MPIMSSVDPPVTSDREVWAEAAYLQMEVTKVEIEERACSKPDTVPSSETLNMFLKSEATLTD